MYLFEGSLSIREKYYMYETIKAGENIIYKVISIYILENISYMHNNNIGRYSSYQ